MPVKSLSPAAFKKALARYAKKVPEKVALEIHGKIALEYYKQIVQRTPVLTGRARYNWNVSFNRPDPSTTKDTSSVDTTGVDMTPDERAKAQAVLRNIQFGKLGTTLWISNHLPYIYFLEHGSSLKAPEGIVEGAILAGLEVLHSKSLKVSK